MPEGPGAVAESFAALARELLGVHGVPAPLDTIVGQAVLTVDGCEHAASR